MEQIFVGLGGNIGDAKHVLTQVMDELDQLAHTRVEARSSLYRSKPMGLTDQPDFINAVVRLRSALEPLALLAQLQALEQRHGRVRQEKNGPRTVDLDLLLYGQRQLRIAGLTLPHPRMHERAFVLRPLCEIAPECVVPGRGSARTLLTSLPEQGVWQLEHS